MYSFLFRGALVADGSGQHPARRDVALEGEVIAAVAERIDAPAVRVVEAGGLVLAPGFIDIHSHTDATLFRYPGAESKLFQGVTVEVTGNCGLGMFPVESGRERELAGYLAMHEFALPARGLAWRDFTAYADEVDRLDPGVNLAPLVGHAPLRIAVMGMDDRPPTAAETARMEQLLAEALRQGAWGMSTGLIYPPGSYAPTTELVALARTVAGQQALYASHIRDEGEGLLEALGEAIAIGRESGVRVQVSHLKALGKRDRGRAAAALVLLAEARLAGVDIGADQYPYDASATTLTALVPQWAHAGGVAALAGRLTDPGCRGRLLMEIDAALEKREGADGVMVTGCRSERNRRSSGQTLARIAAARGCSPAEAVISLLLEEDGVVGAIFFSMAAEDVSAILADPDVAVGSDGQGMNAAEAGDEPVHPRSYGAFARVLGRSVREEGLLPLASAIHKMTGLPAARLGFADRGLVRPGYAADLAVFDPRMVGDPADYNDPHRYAVGMVHLLVNGVEVIRDGTLTGRRSGRVLRRKQT